MLHLKNDCSEFSKEENIKSKSVIYQRTAQLTVGADRRSFGSKLEIIKKYSNFVGHPIYVNGDRINLIQALWLEDPKNITEEMHEEFYKFIGNPYDKPRYIMQYKTDAPLNIRSLFYIPMYKPSKRASDWLRRP